MDLESLWKEFAENHDKSFSNKAAARRARTALGSLKKLVTSYRQASVEEGK